MLNLSPPLLSSILNGRGGRGVRALKATPRRFQASLEPVKQTLPVRFREIILFDYFIHHALLEIVVPSGENPAHTAEQWVPSERIYPHESSGAYVPHSKSILKTVFLLQNFPGPVHAHGCFDLKSIHQ